MLSNHFFTTNAHLLSKQQKIIKVPLEMKKSSIKFKTYCDDKFFEKPNK